MPWKMVFFVCISPKSRGLSRIRQNRQSLRLKIAEFWQLAIYRQLKFSIAKEKPKIADLAIYRQKWQHCFQLTIQIYFPSKIKHQWFVVLELKNHQWTWKETCQKAKGNNDLSNESKFRKKVFKVAWRWIFILRPVIKDTRT